MATVSFTTRDRTNNRIHRGALLALLLTPCALAWQGPEIKPSGHNHSAGATLTSKNVQANTRPAEDSWADSRHAAMESRADELASWVDGFFGTGRSVEESPHTIVRVRPQYEWDEQDGTDWRLRAAGRLYLPAASDRLSVVFFGSDNNKDDFYDPAVVADQESATGLQYEIPLEERSTAYLFAGVKAGPQGKVGARYRYQVPFLQNNRLRFSEELFWIGGDGAGTLTRFDIDHALSDSTLLRWASRAEYSEESNGVEWNSRIAWVRRFDQRSALRLFTFIRGESDPKILNSRGFGIAYRRRFLRDWLHWELEPRYAWRKRPKDVDREGVAMLRLRLEITFGKHQATP